MGGGEVYSLFVLVVIDFYNLFDWVIEIYFNVFIIEVDGIVVEVSELLKFFY